MGIQRQSFTIPGRLMGLNEYVDACRTNKHVGAKAKSEQTEAVTWSIRSAGLKPMDGPIEVGISWIEGRKKNGALRDVDNIQFASKFILDGLVDCGIVPDDSPKFIRNVYHHYRFNANNPHIEVTVMPYNPDGRMVGYLPVTGI
jgi:Holliday junction resolvase RusA-like endonuclease